MLFMFPIGSRKRGGTTAASPRTEFMFPIGSRKDQVGAVGGVFGIVYVSHRE